MMKKILIVGENSYIGKKFASFAGDQYAITVAGARNAQWRDIDFSQYDSVLHCAGIAHVSQKKELEHLYYAINCDLTVEAAQKSKEAGVKQFIFLSSMAVYGNVTAEITADTIPRPESFYCLSKLKGEQGVQALAEAGFKVCIVRPPMVYGADCKGNFPKLVKLAPFCLSYRLRTA